VGWGGVVWCGVVWGEVGLTGLVEWGHTGWGSMGEWDWDWAGHNKWDGAGRGGESEMALLSRNDGWCRMGLGRARVV